MDERRVTSEEEREAERAEQPAGQVHDESGGGARYQEAHRQHAIERDVPRRTRSARGTGEDRMAPLAPAGASARPEHRGSPPDAARLSSNDCPADDHPDDRPHPDDESWLKDQGYPKVGEHVESHATQIEHGPNAGGSQQGHTDTVETGTGRHGERSS